jgi:integrase
MPGHVTKRGSRWRARYPDPLRGGTTQIERVFGTKTAAQDWLLDMQHSAKTGTFIDPAASARRFADVVDEWRATWTDLEPKTKAGYASILNKHLLPRYADAPVANITPDAVQKLVNELATDHAPNTVRRVYTVLRAILALAVRRRYLASNAADQAKLPKKAPKNKARLYLTAAQVRTLAEAMPERYRVATYVAAYCGLRAGELWALRRKDVDLLHGELHVRQALKDINTTSEWLTAAEKGLLFGPTKTHAERKLSLPSPIKAMLAEHLAGPFPGGASPDALIFTAPEGGPVRHGLFYQRVFKPTLRGDERNKDPKKRRKAALPKALHALRWHDMRHTCAALSLEVQPNLAMVQARLGHEDIRTTINVYGHLLPSVEAALADGLTATFNDAQRPNVQSLRSAHGRV